MNTADALQHVSGYLILIKRPARWLLIGWLVAGVIDLWLPHPHAYLCDPATATGAILIGLAISGATTAASIGLQYLVAKHQKVTPVDRGKQDDLRVSVPGYGEAIPWARGLMRNAPVWTYAKPIYDVPQVTQGHSGGKGGVLHPGPPSPTVTEHRYYTTLEGVFRDCKQRPIINVTRIWFNADIVWNTGDQLSANLYEAESATLGGTANSVTSSIASNGHKVTGIGSGAANSVTFSVPIAGVGDYDIAIFYLDSTSDLQYEVMLDNVSQGFISCPSSGAGLLATATIGLTGLTVATHLIKLRNTSAVAPDLDRIEIVETVSLSGGTDARIFSNLTDPNTRPPTDQIKPWAGHNAHPLELNTTTGLPLAGTSTITANLNKWGNPQIRIDRGTADQPADPAIIADKGVDNVPAHRGLANIVIEAIQLPEGALPNVTIESDDGIRDVDITTKDLYLLGGITDTYLDVTALSGLTLDGVIRTSQKPIGDTLKDLQTRFQFDMIEVDGVVKAVMRNRTNIDFVIPFAKLRAHLEGSETPPQDAIITDIDPLNLPAEVQVNYLDPGLDYHNGIQFDLALDTYRHDVQSFSLAVVENSSNIKKLCSTLLHKAEMEGRSFSFETGWEFFPVIPGSVGQLQLPNTTHTVRISDGKYGLPVGICQFQAVRQAASVYSPTGFGSISGVEAPIAGFPSNTKVIILDAPLLRPEDAGDGQQPVWYVGACGIGGGAWPGAFTYQEIPIGSGSYNLLVKDLIFNQASGVGVSTTALGNVSDITIWDTVSSLTVNFYYDPGLSTHTQAEVEDNAALNLLGVENPTTHEVEWVQFRTATPLTPASPFAGKYTLTNFLRGRAYSDYNTGVHTTADNVLVIDSTVKIKRFQIGDIGT